MRKRCFLAGLLTVCILSVSILSAAAGQLPQPAVEAKSALLMETQSGKVLYALNPDATVYPASLTKIMTCLLTLEKGTLSDTVTVSETALAGLDEAGSSIGMQAGEAMSLENLLYAMMLSSANEACNVAAEYISGSIEDFVSLMNERAAQLGCTGTHFANTHGLHDDDHYTTVSDLARITQAAMKNKTFRVLVSAPTYTLPETNLSPSKRLTTTNRLIIPNLENKYYDSRVTGVKTGFTTPAGRCLAATAEDGTLKLLSIVCGCETTILENGDLEFSSFPETKKLLDFGFENYTFQTVLTTLYPLAEIPVSRSAGTGYVSLAPKEELTALLPSDYDPVDLVFTTSLITPEGVTAPVAAGEELGSVTISYDGEELGTIPLVAITAVERASFLEIINPARYTTQTWLRLLLVVLFLLGILFFLILLLYRYSKRRKRHLQRKMREMQKDSVVDFQRSDWFGKE